MKTRGEGNQRGRDDDLSIHQFPLEGRVLSLLVGGGDQGVTLILEPLPQTQLILSGTQKAGLLFGVFTALFVFCQISYSTSQGCDEEVMEYLRHREP